ncbi:hypothetical protein GE061_013612 [Apolygus lucorum]|uniref:Large ribosomal subunit protein bL34m n=1 Tax=Apolygus lucorum TaxID=248454 RepID=A0A6A4JNJ6_APOLU|nr:hypothetical protein GE061_013612 [Apolygus lucorum]
MSQFLRKFWNTFVPSVGMKTYKNYGGVGKVATKTSPNAIERYMWNQVWRAHNGRYYFPRANEVKRVRKHGWEARMSTEGGRKVIMNRILKGRHVLSH